MVDPELVPHSKGGLGEGNITKSALVLAMEVSSTMEAGLAIGTSLAKIGIGY